MLPLIFVYRKNMLYNKYRSKTFSQIVGQESVVRTLCNAIIKDKVPHTLLFEGLRGTGKTTTARVLAMAVNCEATVEGDPCLECDRCKDPGTNIIELDAGINRSVKEIEALHDVLRLRPLRGKKRVVIIDECHMLTADAANAALKLFEEPPSHIILILCTTGQTNGSSTKAAKAFNTLVSRCMQFKFSAVDVINIYSKLKYICQQEERGVEDEILRSIARKAKGSVRDAEGLLDSVLTFSDAPMVMGNDVRWLISVEEDKALDILEALCNPNPFESVLLVDKLYAEGFNLFGVANSVAELAVAALDIELTKESFYPDSQKERLITITQTVDNKFLLDIIRTVGQIPSSSLSDGKQDLEIALADLSYSVATQPSSAW